MNLKLQPMRTRQPAVRLIFLLSACAIVLFAQATLSVNQLVAVVESSIKLKHPDRQVATYLLKQKLSERLELRAVEELQGLGAGPATVEALRKLSEISAKLPSAAPKPEKITPLPIPPPPLA